MTVGATAEFLGFVCEQPRTNPRAVSSLAASNAPPQFGSLPATYDQYLCAPVRVLLYIGCDSPCSATGIIEVRAYVMRKTILRTLWHDISFGTLPAGERSTARGLLYVPESRSRAVSTASDRFTQSASTLSSTGWMSLPSITCIAVRRS